MSTSALNFYYFHFCLKWLQPSGSLFFVFWNGQKMNINQVFKTYFWSPFLPLLDFYLFSFGQTSIYFQHSKIVGFLGMQDGVCVYWVSHLSTKLNTRNQWCNIVVQCFATLRCMLRLCTDACTCTHIFKFPSSVGSNFTTDVTMTLSAVILFLFFCLFVSTWWGCSIFLRCVIAVGTISIKLRTMTCDCDWESWSENILLSPPRLSLCRRRSDGTWLEEQRKHVFESNSMSLLWQVPPRRCVCRRCTSKKDWLGAGSSRENRLRVISPPPITAQQVVSWLLLLIRSYFVIWRFSDAAVWGPPPAHISDARRSCLWQLIHQQRNSAASVHLCVLDIFCPSHFSSLLIPVWQNKPSGSHQIVELESVCVVNQ